MTRTANLSIEFSDEQAMILASAKDFCRDKSDINAVRALLKSDTGFNSDVWNEMIALGWTGLYLPEQHGGSEMGIGATIPLVESMGRHLLSTPFISSTIAAQAIMRGGSEEQQVKWKSEVKEGLAMEHEIAAEKRMYEVIAAEAMKRQRFVVPAARVVPPDRTNRFK